MQTLRFQSVKAEEEASIMNIQYITNRELKNSKGEIKGKVRIIKYKEEKLARVKYKCPECGYEGEMKLPFKKPFRFSCQK